jgi:hypothetical protein
MVADWDGIEAEVKPWKDTGTYAVSGLFYFLILEHQLKKSNKF